jgi:probable HAF family extracellular repeat protein
MTLNITILSPSAIHQSADFQLTDLKKDADGNWKVLENAPKIVALRFGRWSGLLTYCGMGKWDGVRTDQRVSEWLSCISKDATFDDVVQTVRREGSLWIEKINRSRKKIERHSFVLAGFEDGNLRYAIISNYQTLTGEISPPVNDLQVEARATTGVHVFVTGARDAVTGDEKRFLKRLARSGTDFGAIQHHLAVINRRAAGPGRGAKKGISEPCLTYTCVPNGTQWSRVHGAVPEPVIPVVAGGEDSHANFMHQFMHQHFPKATLVQSAYGTSETLKSDIEEHIDCKLRFQSGSADRVRPAIAEAQEVGSINEYVLDVKAINGSQAIVGNISVLPDQTPRAFFSHDGQIVCLGSFSGAVGYAHDLNESNQVVGCAGVNGGGMHAFIWSERDGLHDLGTLGGRSSHASSINDHGVVVGTSGRQPGEQKARDERAFIWSQEHKMEALDAPEFDGWSRAFKVNNLGWVIGWRGRDSVDCGYVWSREFGFIELRVGPGRPFFVCAMNDSGLVVGEGDDEFGKRRPYCWTRDTGVRRLETDELFQPCGVDPGGIIIGNVRGGSCPWERPFVYTPAHELLPLPYADDDHTSLAAINSVGIVVGGARRSGSWKHVHPIIWRLVM